MKKMMIWVFGCMIVCFNCWVVMASDVSEYKFSAYDERVIVDSIFWENDAENLSEAQLSLIKRRVIDSDFHASLGKTCFGSLGDFITAMSKMYPTNGVQMTISNFRRAVEKPYSVNNPLLSFHCTLLITYKPVDGKTLAYRFKFLFYSDTQALRRLAIANTFPGADKIDTNTYLVMIKEHVTDNYPDDFVKMDTASFDKIVSWPITIIKDYITK